MPEDFYRQGEPALLEWAIAEKTLNNEQFLSD